MAWTTGAERRGATRPVHGLLAGAALTVAVTALVALLEPLVPDLLGMPLLYLLAVLPVAIRWGAGPGAAVAAASAAVFAGVFVRPRLTFQAADTRYAVAVGVFLLTALAVVFLAARLRRKGREPARSSGEQAALHEAATLVAQGAPASEVFEAVTRGIGRLCEADVVGLERFGQGGSTTEVARWSREGAFPDRIPFHGADIARQVRLAGAAVRVGSGTAGTCPSIGVPVVVDGRVWGLITASRASGSPFGRGAESLIRTFAEFVASTADNSRRREELARLAAEQAGLRRVATLVAHGAPPQEVFGSANEEIARLLEPDRTTLVRFEADGTATFLAGIGWRGRGMHIGRTIEVPPPFMPLQSGNVVRIDDVREHPDLADTVTKQAVLASVACPIIVEGRIWGAFGVESRRGALPAETEQRLVDVTELIGTALANAESRAEISRLLAHQASLRRVATLVAREVPPDEIFQAVADEIGQVFGADILHMVRVDPDGGASVIARMGDHAQAVGERYRFPPGLAMTEALQTGAPARRDHYGDVGDESYADAIRHTQIRSGVAIPICVDGRTWGTLGMATRDEPFPAQTEQRLADYTELVALAIVNAASRSELHRLLDEQAALRRLAVLVARGQSPLAVCTAVAEECRRLLGIEEIQVVQYEPDGTGVLLVALAAPRQGSAPGTRFPLDDVDYLMQSPRRYAALLVWRTGRAARLDSDRWDDVARRHASGPRWQGVRSVSASPIVVDGRLWGSITVTARREPLRADTEERMTRFAELVAMAIGNAQSRAELAASRARIVAASDETRRRIERDLHDGAQQRLVSMGLELRLTQAGVPERLPQVRADLGRLADEVTAVLDELREMARGIHPAILSEGGLRPALRTLARRSPIPVTLDVLSDRRFPEPIEVAAYYVVSEALTNAAKHAGASDVGICLTEEDGALHLSVRDDGVGGADPQRGSGLIGLRDRVEALGGTILVESPQGAGTTMLVTLPITPEPASVNDSRGRSAPQAPYGGPPRCP